MSVLARQVHPAWTYLLYSGIGLAAVLGYTFLFFLPAWCAAYVYLECPCVVLQKGTKQTTDSDGDTLYRPEVRIHYTVNGQPHDVWATRATSNYLPYPQAEAFLDHFQIGNSYPCWYDPQDPSRVVVERGFGWTLYLSTFVMAVVLLASLAVGTLGVSMLLRRKPSDPLRPNP